MASMGRMDGRRKLDAALQRGHDNVLAVLAEAGAARTAEPSRLLGAFRPNWEGLLQPAVLPLTSGYAPSAQELA